MKGILELLNQPLSYSVGWALVNSLWQGGVIALAFKLSHPLLCRRSANARYLAACAMLAIMAAAPVVTFYHELVSLSSGAASVVGAGPVPWGITEAFSAGGPGLLGSDGSLAELVQRGVKCLETMLPWLVMVWSLGVIIFAGRWFQGFWWVRRLKTVDTEDVGGPWVVRLNDLRNRLRIGRPVRLLRSALVEVPVVAGWLRPVILLPVSTVSGLTPEQLEAILAHELAHVKRFDYLVNAFQNLVETLMFYHPAVWWISGCIREEREHCCDDLVVEICGDRKTYARALLTLEEMRGVPRWAFAATGGSLLHRIRRVLGVAREDSPSSGREWGGLVIAGIGVMLVCAGVLEMMKSTTYRSAALVKISPDFGVENEAVPRGIGLSAFDRSFLQTEVVVMRSAAVLDSVIRTLHLDEVWARPRGSEAKLPRAEALSLLRARLELRPIRSTWLVEIQAADSVADGAARIANAVAAAYLDRRIQQRGRSAQNGIKALEMALDDQDSRILEAQKKVDELRIELRIPDAAASAPSAADENAPVPLLSAESLRRIEGLRIDSQAEYVRQKTLVDKLKKHKLPELIQVLPAAGIKDAPLDSLIEQLSLAEQKLEGMQKEFGPGAKETKGIASQIEDLQQQISVRAEGVMHGLEAKLNSLGQGLTDLSNEVVRATRADNELVAATRPYYQAKRQLEEMVQFRQKLLGKIASERTDGVIAGNPVGEIVDEAVPPSRASSPNRARAMVFIAAGLLTGLFGLALVKMGGAIAELPKAA